jgi:hypothetical protein
MKHGASEAPENGAFWLLAVARRQDACLHALCAILREIKVKGADGRFRKTERGKFELKQK